ncbi:MAG TPA: LuxR C-terminal-related transcriptional regulator [Burkholderiales bacterium]|nr:LuxR C-terminal-related transcriptional regulator [Burkholderiales bacterium]
MPQGDRSAGSTPRFSSRDLRATLDTLHAIGEGCAGSADFARRGVEHLPRLVGSELTTLVVCDLEKGHRTVVPSGMVSRREIEVFDRYFRAHPLVCEHGRNPNAVTKRITDLVAPREFRRTPLYNDYYRPIRIEHVLAVPLHVDGRFLVSFVFNRGGGGFTDRERDLTELMRPHLANLYRLGVAIEKTRDLPADAPFDRAAAPLTSREREVLDWVAAGKTNRDVAAILGASPRTVEKHLERIYEKLGVETRTAAVMRAIKLAHSN